MRCRGISDSRLFFVLLEECGDVVLYFGLSAAVLLLNLLLLHAMAFLLLFRSLESP
jgi:hypothetical protein